MENYIKGKRISENEWDIFSSKVDNPKKILKLKLTIDGLSKTLFNKKNPQI